MASEADKPLVSPTVPMLSAFLLANVRPVTPVAAKVLIVLLAALSKVTLPPSNSKLEATT